MQAVYAAAKQDTSKLLEKFVDEKLNNVILFSQIIKFFQMKHGWKTYIFYAGCVLNNTVIVE